MLCCGKSGTRGCFISVSLVLLILHSSELPVRAVSQALVPDVGAYFGVSVDLGKDTVASYVSRTGLEPAVYNLFMPLPLDQNATEFLPYVLPQISEEQAVVMLTVMPNDGLDAVTEDAIAELASYILTAEQAGASVMVRFAHEMNGNWYVWGQQPVAYVKAFRLVHDVLHNLTCSVVMVWAPNVATGYPWRIHDRTTQYGAEPGTADYKALDTNGDKHVNAKDDPFSPYYPGDQYVEWVGMSVDHFGGKSRPYVTNVKATPRYYTNVVTGNIGNVPNFYARYCNDTVHKKPMVIAETTSMYLPNVKKGDSDYAIKSTWWQQVFNVQGDTNKSLDISQHFAMIKMVVWFDELKQEENSNYRWVDWQFSRNATILQDFKQWLAKPVGHGPNKGKKYWKLLDDFRAERGAWDCATQSVPTMSDVPGYAGSPAVPPPPPWSTPPTPVWQAPPTPSWHNFPPPPPWSAPPPPGST